MTSPLQRAARTCELAGFGTVAEVDGDLLEWNYGDYEGRRTVEIQAERPDWQLFRDGCPGGESPEQVGARADRLVNRVRTIQGMYCYFRAGISCGCSLRAGSGSNQRAVDTSCWGTASLSALGYEHNLSESVIRLWNETHHVGT